ncbi:Nnf1 protein [Pochonia chlamydosporia 170]|uniref:Nnf1 protein n=1 Tax=Pochonia chlamydosporia 170 TaxID=1380566 RepID=A0A179FXN2_METCM|nr:Nnf1 protein [Pochonia chlamydosporia 170]OAQ70137.1 Nnf1 protein [Pochonia chlamydosporia 170]
MSSEEPNPNPNPNPEPGPRAIRLHQVYTGALTRTLDKLSYENIATCYPTISRRAAPILHQVHAQMVERLKEKCDKEFDSILATRDVVRKMNDLEGLIADAEERRASGKSEDVPTPPHLLPPNEVLAAHLSPHLIEQRGQLNAQLQTTQAQNNVLAEHVRAQRDEIELLLDKLEAAVEDVRCANGVLGGVVGELAGEARGIDKQMEEERR